MLSSKLEWNTLSSGEKEIAQSFHHKNDASLNSFYFDIEYFKNNFPKDYYYNDDGSISLTLTLYFKPQNNIKIGSLITIVTLILLLFYIFIKVFININLRKKENF
jgi:transposase